MFDKLKSIFIVEDENAKKAKPSSNAQKPTPQPKVSTPQNAQNDDKNAFSR